MGEEGQEDFACANCRYYSKSDFWYVIAFHIASYIVDPKISLVFLEKTLPKVKDDKEAYVLVSMTSRGGYGGCCQNLAQSLRFATRC